MLSLQTILDSRRRRKSSVRARTGIERHPRLPIEGLESRLLLSSSNAYASVPIHCTAGIGAVVEIANAAAVSTTTTLTSSSNPAIVGHLVTFTAQVTAASGPPLGNVTFFDGSSVIGTSAINSFTNQATFSTSSLSVGVHSITASYNGSSAFAASTSSVLSQTINPAGPLTVTTLASSANPIEAGQVLALTATVTAPAGGVPTGSVSFFDGSSLIGTAAINSLTNQAIAFTQSLSVGTHNLTAVYGGAPGFVSSTSAVLSQTVNPVGVTTRTTLSASANLIKLGQVIALTATVTSAGGSPTGTVTFFDGSTLIGTVAIDPTTQQAIGFTGSLSLGTHNITAVYNGAVGFATSTSPAVFVTVNPAPAATATALISSSNPVTAGQVIALTATVTAASGSPTGTVTFFDGSTVIGTVLINSSTNRAVGYTKSLSVGAHNVTAMYNGSSSFAASTSPVLVEIVNPVGVATTTTLVTSSNPVNFGQVIALTATVTAASGSPTGTVTFMDGSTLIGTAAIDPSTQQAVGFTNSLTVGAHSLTAVYNGAVGFAASTSSAVNEIVLAVPLATTTTLTSSSNPAIVGHLVTFTAQVTAASGPPLGNVTFFDGSSVIGTSAINSFTNQATFSTSSLSVGVHSITASYNGSSAFAASTSSVLSQTINPAGPLTVTTLASSANPIEAGQVLALTATVTAPAGGVPTGSVSFFDGSSLIGTAAINSLTNQAIAFTQSLSVGTHNLTAVYGGAPGFVSSTSAVLSQTVNPVGVTTRTTLSASANLIKLGQVIALTATVTSAGGSPTGTVTFFDGSTLIGTVAIDPTTQQAIGFTGSLSLGTHNITAVYNGAVGFATSTSLLLQETVHA